MANGKSIIEEALLEAEKIDAAFKSNAKEILAQTMSSEIEEMVKESLTGSKKKRLKEDNEEEEETDLDLDSENETEEVEETEEGEELEGEMDLDLTGDEEGEETEDMNLDLGGESEEGEMDLDLGGEETEDMEDLDLGGESEEGEMDLDLTGGEGEGEEGLETIDLTGANDADTISVFKKMGPEDEIEVVNDNGTVTLKDNRSGSEYRIELNPTGISDMDTEMDTEMEDMDTEMEPEMEGLGEGEEDSDDVIYEIVVDDEETNEDYMSDEESEDFMSGNEDYMYGEHPVSDEDAVNGMNPNGETEETDYMSRVKSRVGRYRTGNRTNTYAQQRMAGPHIGESKTSQVTKLIKENTNLHTKNSTIEKENKELKENQDKMVDALKQFRKKLQEVAIFNSNLTYAVRLFTENSTTKEEKQEILKRLDSAKDLRESQSIYRQLVKEYTSGKAPIKETVEEKINKTASSGAQISEQSVFIHPELENMKRLWEYSYKK